MTARILVIDDEHIYAKTVALHLSSLGYHTFIEESGASGINFVSNNSDIDLIILDLMMPDMYGLDVLRILKEHPYARHIPVILQTGIEDEAEINKGLVLGAAMCLRKPFNRADLHQAIEGVLRTKPVTGTNSGTLSHTG